MRRVAYIIPIIALLAIACTPQDRLNRLLTKHPELTKNEVKLDTVIIRDTLNDGTVVYRDSIVHDTTTIIKPGETRYQTRYNFRANKQREKTLRDSISMLKTEIIQSKRTERNNSKNETIRVRSDNKDSNLRWWALIVGLILAALVVLYLITRKFLKQDG